MVSSVCLSLVAHLIEDEERLRRWRDEARWRAVVAETVSRFGRLDTLANNAGLVRFADIETMSYEEFRLQVDVMLGGTFLGCRAALPLMSRDGSGSIINMASVAGLKGISAIPAYTAAKAGVIGMTRSIAVHCQEAKNRIRVNAIAPGGIVTPMTAQALADQKAVGWFQGRMEFGPRALGHRSILGDPRSPQLQSVLNLKVKFRESFRPFAPAVLRERAAEFFELDEESPYMLFVAPVHPDQRLEQPAPASGLARLKQVRSRLPAITHVDYSARVQTVTAEQNPVFHALLKCFEAKTGCPVLMNTSFNVRGEPVVCTPDDAYRCFVNTEMDYLAIGNFLLERTVQPHAGVKPSFHPVPD